MRCEVPGVNGSLPSAGGMAETATPGHAGPGRWTLYTVSAGWMLSFILESLLGLNIESDRLRIAPCFPAHWTSFQVNHRHRQTLYRIKVPHSAVAYDGSVLTVDGVEHPAAAIPLIDDGCEYAAVVRIRKTGA